MEFLTQILIDVIADVIAGNINDVLHHAGGGESVQSLIASDPHIASNLAHALSAHGISMADMSDADWAHLANSLFASVRH